MAKKKNTTEELDILGQIDMGSGANKELLNDVIEELRSIQELPDFLRDTMSEDVKRYFNATSPVEQLMTKGAYFRTKWLLNLIAKKGDPKPKEKKGKSVKIGRYAE